MRSGTSTAAAELGSVIGGLQGVRRRQRARLELGPPHVAWDVDAELERELAKNASTLEGARAARECGAGEELPIDFYFESAGALADRRLVDFLRAELGYDAEADDGRCQRPGTRPRARPGDARSLGLRDAPRRLSVRRLQVRRVVGDRQPVLPEAGSRAAAANERTVADDSLMEEMRAALKGDRERAEQRRRSPRPEKTCAGPARARCPGAAFSNGSASAATSPDPHPRMTQMGNGAGSLGARRSATAGVAAGPRRRL